MKTSIAVAKLLRRRDVRLAGLTSAPNLDFVERLRLFDQIAAYGEIDELPDRGPVLFVDVAGNKTVRRAVHERMAEQLVASITIGATHWDAEEEPEQPLPGPTPELFAAPAYIERRTAEWGADVLEQRVAAGWQEFVADVPAWLRVEAHSGPDAVLALYGDVINGRVDPAVGHVASMWLSETAH